MPTKTSNITTYQILNGAFSTGSANERTELWDVPAKVSGQWVSLGNGGRFRTPTSYTRHEVRFTRGRGYDHLLERYPGYTFRRWSGPGGRIDNFFGGSWVVKLGPAGIPSIVGPPAFVTNERNESVTKSLNKIADQKANLGEGLANLGVTARMFIRPIRGYLNYLNKGNPSAKWWRFKNMAYVEMIRGRVPKAIAEKYLEYVYGIVPLMQDIYGIAELMKEQGLEPLLLSAHANSRSESRLPDLVFDNASLSQDEKWTDIRVNSITRTSLWATPSTEYPLPRTLNQLGLANPAALIWEVIPYSFLVDWVVPIGPVLNAFTAPAGLDFAGGSVSRRVKATWSYSSNKQGNGWKVLRNDPATGTAFYNGYRRDQLKNWPRPGFYYNADPLGLSRDGSDRVFKALALSVARLPYL